MSGQGDVFTQAVPAAAPPVPVGRVRSALRRIVGAHWTPTITALVSVLFILTGAGGAVLQTRLAEMAAVSGPAVEAPAGIQTLAPAYDFTLAPEDIRPISEDEARAFNSGLPFSTLPIIAARPFIMPTDKLDDYARALDCLTAAIYFEAANEPPEGQQAVAQVVINRMRHPAFPKTICGVVFQGSERSTGCQFSFTCDGALARTPSAAGWARARAVAGSALNGSVAGWVGMATHYHTDYVAPYWAERLVKIRQIGAHIFYRWTGAWGLPGAFSGRHAGAEPVIVKLARLATPVESFDTVVVPDAAPLLADPALRLAPVVLAPIEEPDETVADVAAPEEEVAPPPPPPAPRMSNPLAAPPPSAATGSSMTAGPPPTRRPRIAVPN